MATIPQPIHFAGRAAAPPSAGPSSGFCEAPLRAAVVSDWRSPRATGGRRSPVAPRAIRRDGHCCWALDERRLAGRASGGGGDHVRGVTLVGGGGGGCGGAAGSGVGGGLGEGVGGGGGLEGGGGGAGAGWG